MNNNKANYKFIDLFAGIGGMRIAFERCGCECVFSSEWDKFSQQTIMKTSANYLKEILLK